MQNAPHEDDRDDLPPSPRTEEEPESDYWRGVHLELEDPDARPGAGFEDETVERPIAELLSRRPARPLSRVLPAWLLFGGSVSAALVAASLVLALLAGGAPVEWRATFLAFCAVVVVFLVRHYLLNGMRPGGACRQALCLGGLAVTTLTVLEGAIRSFEMFLAGAPAIECLAGLLAVCLLGLASAWTLYRCIQTRGWAGRVVAVSLGVALVLVLAQPFIGYALLGGTPPLPALPGNGLACLVMAAAFGLGLAVWHTLARLQNTGATDSKDQRVLRVVIEVAWAVLMVGAVVALTHTLAGSVGLPEASAALWRLSAAIIALALAPVAAIGARNAWRSRLPLQDDLVGAAHFSAAMVALAALACLGLWTATHLPAPRAELFIGCAAILAVMVGAWLVYDRGDWAGRWGLVPAIGLAVAAMCALPALLTVTDGAAQQGGALTAGLVWMWTVLVVVLSFGAAGLAVKRMRARAMQPGMARWTDAQMLCTAGLTITGLLLAVGFARLAGDQALRSAMGAILAWLRLGARDALATLGPAWLGPRIAAALSGMGVALAGTRGTVLLGAVLLTALAVHLLAAARVRWSFYALAGIWAAVVLASLVGTVLYSSQLISPTPAHEFATAPFRIMSRSYSARLVVLAALVALIFRFGEATRSVVALLKQPAVRWESSLQATIEFERTPGLTLSRHLAFLVRTGVLASLAGLAVAVLMLATPRTESAAGPLRALTSDWFHEVVVFCTQIGATVSGWAGYALCLAVVVFVIAALHEEARRGRRSVYLLVGTLWVTLLLGLGVMFLARVRPLIEQVSVPSLAFLVGASMLLVILLATAGAVLYAGLSGGRVIADGGAYAGGDPDRREAAHSLGSLGLAACLMAVALMVYALSASVPGLREAAAELPGALARLARAPVQWLIALQLKLESDRNVGIAAVALGGLSMALLALHLLCQRPLAWARTSVFTIWCAVVLAAVAWLGHAVARTPIGEWSAGRVIVISVVVAGVVRAIVALANARTWLRPRPT